MARIIRSRARKPLAEGPPMAGVVNFREDGGLTFRMRIGDVLVVLSQLERDNLIESWAKSQLEFES